MSGTLHLLTHLPWLLFLWREEQNWCEFFVDWKATPMNFCNKKLRYSCDGLYQIAGLDSKALTLSSTQYYENRIHTRSWRTSVINVYVACPYMTFLGLLLKLSYNFLVPNDFLFEESFREGGYCICLSDASCTGERVSYKRQFCKVSSSKGLFPSLESFGSYWHFNLRMWCFSSRWQSLFPDFTRKWSL